MSATSDKLNVMFLDIEATNLKADFGYMLCASWKWEGLKKVHHRSIAEAPTFEEDPTDDAWIIEELRPELEKADVVVFHYGSRFDYPYLQTRALYHRLEPLPRVRWIDTWRIARNQLALSSNRLASLSRLLGVEEKTPLSGPVWIRAMAGHAPSIRYVVEHCDQDVIVLEQVYQRIKALRPTDGQGPKLGFHGDCPTCGSSNTIRKGFERTVKKQKQRMKCNDCGHWWTLAVQRQKEAA